jgi:serine/threonine protein kinase
MRKHWPVHEHLCQWIGTHAPDEPIEWRLKENFSERYAFQKRLGEGQYAKVNMVKRGDTMLAVKILTNDDDADLEVAVSRKLSKDPRCHKHIVCYRKHFMIPRGRREPRKAIVYNLIEGETLLEYAAKPLERKPHISQLLLQSLSTLSYIHELGVIWVDPQAENLMVTNDGRKIVFIDFGNACLSPCQEYKSQAIQYAAPERVERFANPSFSTDVFSLAVCFVAAFIGKEPNWVRRDVQQDKLKFNDQLLDSFIADLETIDRTYPVIDVLYDMLADEPEQRPSAAEARDRVVELLQ